MEVKHASFITPEEEEKLWTTEILSVKTPKGLQRAVFYYIGKRFCIQGGQKQRNLGPSNFKWRSKPGDDLNCVTYIEHESKNRSGGLIIFDLRTRKCHVIMLYITKSPNA